MNKTPQILIKSSWYKGLPFVHQSRGLGYLFKLRTGPNFLVKSILRRINCKRDEIN